MVFGECNHNELILFLGADGSGKSTAIASVGAELAAHGPTETLEQTKAEGLLAFKLKNYSRPVDLAYVDEREALFADDNNRFTALIADSRQRSRYTLIDGHPMVTSISHDLMRDIIGYPDAAQRHANPDALLAELEPQMIPDYVVFLGVSPEERRRRIVLRDKPEEMLWGFNAPFFLERYQTSLRDCSRTVVELASRTFIGIDTGSMNIDDMRDTITSQILGSNLPLQS